MSEQITARKEAQSPQYSIAGSVTLCFHIFHLNYKFRRNDTKHLNFNFDNLENSNA